MKKFSLYKKPNRTEDVPLKTMVQRHVFEIRHETSFSFLDQKGRIADSIAHWDKFNFSLWKPGQDRVEFYDESKKIRVYFSLTNFGMESEDSPSIENFKEKADLFIDLIAKFNFNKTPKKNINRIGFRSFYLMDIGKNFKELQKFFLVNYLNVNSNIKEIFGGELIDVGAALNYKDGRYFYNTNAGPMQKPQINSFFPDIEASTLPKQGIYFEIDYFRTNLGNIDAKDLKSNLDTCINSTKLKFKNFQTYISNVNE